METSSEAIMGALLSLRPQHFSNLTHTLVSDLRLQHQRLFFLLLSPPHFSKTLAYIQALTLGQKTLLLARILLRSLKSFTQTLDDHKPMASGTCHKLSLREFDAGVLLITMCEVYDRNNSRSSGFDWHAKIMDHVLENALSPAGLGAHGWAVLGRCIDVATKCRRLLDAVSSSRGKTEGDVGASMATVISLPSVECLSVGKECVICKEEIELGRDVCELPCDHLFHWMCILPWLRKKNTCPCCRFELPTDDVFCEIERIMRDLVREWRRNCSDDV